MRFSGCFSIIFASASFALQTEGQPNDVTVLVLDALNGKPQGNIHVEYFCTGIQHNSPHARALTNAQGLAKLSDHCGVAEDIEISVYPADKKEQCGVGPASLKEILSAGIVTKPDADGGIWCPTKVSKKLKPVPGQITMFVKKPTWWQAHVAG
jgi:hypothetical protein